MPLILFDKAWQAQSPAANFRLVIKCSAKQEMAWESLYIDIQLRAGELSITFSAVKPDFIVATGSVVAQTLRKNLQGYCLVAVMKHATWRDLLWVFKGSEEGEEKLIILHYAKPPVLELAINSVSLLRVGQSGVFTKRKNLELDRTVFATTALDEFFSLNHCRIY